MNNVRKLLLILIGVLALQRASAQSLHIKSDVSSFLTVPLDTTLLFNVAVHNDSTTIVNGALTFGYSISDLSTSVTYTTSDTSGNSSGVAHLPAFASLNQGDSIIVTLKTTVTLPKFKVGPSVVVIWPIVPGAAALDSVKIFLTVFGYTGVDDIAENRLNAFIFNNQLHIRTGADLPLKRLRVYNITGQQILEQLNPATSIPLPAMPKGIYLAEIIYGDNQRSIFRFCN